MRLIISQKKNKLRGVRVDCNPTGKNNPTVDRLIEANCGSVYWYKGSGVPSCAYNGERKRVFIYSDTKIVSTNLLNSNDSIRNRLPTELESLPHLATAEPHYPFLLRREHGWKHFSPWGIEENARIGKLSVQLGVEK